MLKILKQIILISAIISMVFLEYSIESSANTINLFKNNSFDTTETSPIKKIGDHYTEGNEEVVISIEYDANLLFAKEIMDIYIDNHKFYSVDNGDTNVNIYKLTKGTHELKVSSSIFHSDSEKFEVENTGDFFEFSIKNSTNRVQLSMTTSGNYYSIMGLEIPENIEETDEELIQEQIDIEKTGNTVLGYVWKVLKIILIFTAFCIIFFLAGMFVKEFFSLLNIITIGAIIEFICICFLVLYREITPSSFIFPILFLILYYVTYIRIRNIPEEYKNFSSIKETINNAYSAVFSFVFVVLLMEIPEILNSFPIQIFYVERYIWAYVILISLYVVLALQNDLDYPKKVKEFVDERGVITEEDIIDFCYRIEKNPSNEQIESESNKMVQTLLELSKIGFIEKDDVHQCFKSKNNIEEIKSINY